MPFPKTLDELIKAGYTFESGVHCRGCGEAIEFWNTPRGKKMPMNVDSDGNVESHWANCPNAPQFRSK